MICRSIKDRKFPPSSSGQREQRQRSSDKCISVAEPAVVGNSHIEITGFVPDGAFRSTNVWQFFLPFVHPFVPCARQTDRPTKRPTKRPSKGPTTVSFVSAPCRSKALKLDEILLPGIAPNMLPAKQLPHDIEFFRPSIQ